MTIRFAASRKGTLFGPIRLRSPVLPAMPLAANDNGFEAANDDAMLGEALRFFAQHGLRAARRAGDEALTAHEAGDTEAFDWWLSVCRMLDRRLADAVAAKTALAT